MRITSSEIGPITSGPEIENKYLCSALTDLDWRIEGMIMKRADGSWQCSECEYTSRVKTNIKMHVESRHVVSSGFTCHICQLFCANRKSLRNHLDRKHLKYKTNWCGFLELNEILDIDAEVGRKITQSLDEEGKKIWICLECNYRQKLRKDVVKHIERKHMNLSISCNYCDASMTSRISLRNHIRINHSFL